jgi:3-phosphoshikimate 1-carboxyvinyltransferase
LSTISGVHELCGEPRGTIELRPGDRRPVELEAEAVPRCIDELPLVAVLGALAEGETVVTGAAELRVKESDRITTLVGGLSAMGADIEPLPDGFVVRGGRPLRGARLDPGGDHRIAMALAVAALAAEGETSIEGWGCVGVSYPGFERDLARLAVR